jgi:prolyl-tRNA synthetase
MRQSQLFGSTRKEAPQGEESKNAILLTRGAYVAKEMAGVYSFLPLGFRVLEKIKAIVREEISALPQAQEVLLPALQPKELWVESGRWDEAIGDVMYTVEDDRLGLGPTHEEVITDVFRRYVSSYKQLPVALFQFQTKFRRELRAKSGLLRGREFLMKDLYSFHLSEIELDEYYGQVAAAYRRIFVRCGLNALYTEASGGMFAKYSHEFQVVAEAGEDVLYLNGDSTARNQEIVPEVERKDLPGHPGIEVGNIFKLNKKFSLPMGAVVSDEAGESKEVWMGCYGIGISRLIGTIVEIHGDLTGKIDWPEELAPFRVHLLDLTPDKQGEALYGELSEARVAILYDDRDKTAGEKFADADLIGAPVRVVISKRSVEAGGIEMTRGGQRTVVAVANVLKHLTA